MQYTISPDEQEKHNNIILPTFQAIGLEQMAVVVSDDLFAQVSISQLLEDDTTASYLTSYFDDVVSAMAWLIE